MQTINDMLNAQKTSHEDVKKNEEEAETYRKVACFKQMSTHKKLHVLSDASLDDALDWHLEKGMSYHCISHGDVDTLSFLKRIVKNQRLDYCCVSSWVISPGDAQELLEYVERGYVGRFDFYVGEIFKNGYRGSRDILDKICEKCGGRVARFRNHSKITAFFGERYSGVIEGSANFNINPRCEHTCITIDDELARFYVDFFNDINDFDGGYKEWTPFIM